jgi:HPt (histidine-containing phosphotransfer) domain-containing protein
LASPKRPKHAGTTPELAAAIDANFEGDASMYAAFEESCAAQFALDAVAGQAACARGDLAALRALTHDLKSVLVMLGYVHPSELAAQIERHAEAGDQASADVTWRALHSALLRLQAP